MNLILEDSQKPNSDADEDDNSSVLLKELLAYLNMSIESESDGTLENEYNENESGTGGDKDQVSVTDDHEEENKSTTNDNMSTASTSDTLPLLENNSDENLLKSEAEELDESANAEQIFNVTVDEQKQQQQEKDAEVITALIIPGNFVFPSSICL